MSASQFFQLIRFFGLLLGATTTGAIRCLITVLKLPHLHLKELTQVFTLLLSGTTTATATALLHADIGAIDIRLCLQYVLQCELLWLQRTSDLLLAKLICSLIHLIYREGKIFNSGIVTRIGETETLGKTIYRASWSAPSPRAATLK